MLTAEQHRDVVARLVAHARQGLKDREFGLAAYSNLMVSFLLHQLASADAILSLHRAFGDSWFPTTRYPIVRTLFEVDVTAHYIGQDAAIRARQYIEFGHVLKKRRMDACAKHRGSSDSSWREGMNLEWEHQWSSIENVVNAEHGRVKSTFEAITAKGKTRPFTNWSGKTLYQMAVDVDHVESYDVFYADLSSFSHADVRLANRFLKLPPGGPVFTLRADEGDVAAVFRYAATFLTCFLELFGRESKLWTSEQVRACWRPVGV
jgi:hypothetical protein